LSLSYLSRVETGDRQPSLGTLSVLAQVYGVTLAALFEPEDDPCIVIRGADAPVQKGNDLFYTHLSRRSRTASLQAVKVHVTAQGVALYAHEGEEWLYVLSGQLHLTVGEEAHTLQRGDAAHFKAHIQHRFNAIHENITEVLIVACVDRHPLLKSYL
jgi:quercetin dioxygenase-like cupin family protein